MFSKSGDEASTSTEIGCGRVTSTGNGSFTNVSLFLKATKELAKKLNVDEKLLKEYIEKHFVWHHVEDLETMVLVPKNIHNYVVKHWGASAVLKQNPTQKIIDLWKASLVYIL